MTRGTVSTVDVLAACLPALGATELGRGGNELDVALPVTLSDGRCLVYHLRVSVAGAAASAKERTPTLLPAFCPERHINSDGSFCLYWRAIDDIVIEGPDTALAWWEILVRFLQLQTRAARRRQWPDGLSRAHGAAAVHQFRAERAAECLGDQLFADMQNGRLSVALRRKGTERAAMRVMRNGERIYAVWARGRQVVNLRRPCVCTSGRQPRPRVIRSCGDHATAAATLAMELHSMSEQELHFWKAFEGHRCCGTMDDCPLGRKSTALAAQVGQPQAGEGEKYG